MALTWICVWECERVVKQARSSETWDTYFQICIHSVMCAWEKATK
jgi:hypothetical protein